MIEIFEFLCIFIGFRSNSHAGEGPRHLLPQISIGSTAVNITLERLQRLVSKSLPDTRCTDRSQTAKYFALRETAILSGNDKNTIRKILPSHRFPKQCSLLPPSHPTNTHASSPAPRSRETHRFQDFLSPCPLPPSLSSLGTPKATYPDVPTLPPLPYCHIHHCAVGKVATPGHRVVRTYVRSAWGCAEGGLRFMASL